MRCDVVIALACSLLGCSDKEAPGTASLTAGSGASANPCFQVPGIAVPKLSSRAGTVEVEPTMPVVAASMGEVTLDCRLIVLLANGGFAPEVLEGGAQGMQVRRLTEALAHPASSTGVLTLSVDHRLPFETFMRLLYSAKSSPARWTRFAVITQSQDRLVALPLTLPDPRPGHRQPALFGDNHSIPPTDQPLRMVVAATRTEIVVWSFSGLEGSLQAPKLRVARTDTQALARLSSTLAELVQRRWADGPRPDTSREIVLMADATLPMQSIAELVATLRASSTGAILFPDVLLSSSFE